MKRILICGGAPLVHEEIQLLYGWHESIIFLNGAYRKARVSNLSGDKYLAVSDLRFYERLNIDEIVNLGITKLVTFEHILQKSRQDFSLKILLQKYRSAGHSGFSEKPNEVYHGHTVFHFAFQHCSLAGFTDIEIIGTRLDPPLQYFRSDKTTGLPEYVYPYQVRSLATCATQALKQNITVKVHGPPSTAKFYLYTID